MGTDRRAWPVWVRVGLWKIPTRRLAWVHYWVVFLLATALVVLGFAVDPTFLYGAFLYLAAVWYRQSIAWADDNGGWPAPPVEEVDEIDEKW